MKEIIEHASRQPARAASIALEHMLSHIRHLQSMGGDINFDALTDDVLIFIRPLQSSLVGCPHITGVYCGLIYYCKLAL
jgi:hypothetical protein